MVRMLMSPYDPEQLKVRGKLWRLAFIVISKWTYAAKVDARYLYLQAPRRIIGFSAGNGIELPCIGIDPAIGPDETRFFKFMMSAQPLRYVFDESGEAKRVDPESLPKTEPNPEWTTPKDLP